jgi:hypothetical protein
LRLKREGQYQHILHALAGIGYVENVATCYSRTESTVAQEHAAVTTGMICAEADGLMATELEEEKVVMKEAAYKATNGVQAEDALFRDEICDSYVRPFSTS